LIKLIAFLVGVPAMAGVGCSALIKGRIPSFILNLKSLFKCFTFPAVTSSVLDSEIKLPYLSIRFLI